MLGGLDQHRVTQQHQMDFEQGRQLRGRLAGQVVFECREFA